MTVQVKVKDKIEFINPFLQSIMNVLSTMAMMEASPGKPFVKTTQIAQGDVTGIIGMASDRAKGTLAITFTEPVALEVTTKMLGEKAEEVNETVTDMIGEITNMVTGGAKRVLSEKGYHFDMAIPTVVSGKHHIIRHKSTAPIITVPFETDAGSFFIEVCFEE